ncbi:MAG: hypothetical protein KDB05_30005, partial [Planctomycetales bacterium]|nr:hypothetical protein [Planctomycetales bacterium]
FAATGSGQALVGAELDLDLEAKLDLSALLAQLNSLEIPPPTPDISADHATIQIREFTAGVGAAVVDLSANASLGGDFLSLGVEDARIVAQAGAEIIFNDGEAASLADLRAGSLRDFFQFNAHGSAAAALPITAELAGFNINDFGTPIIQLTTENLFSRQAPNVVIDVLLSDDLQTQILSILNRVREVGDNISASSVLETTIPVLEQSLNQIFAVAADDPSVQQVGDFIDFHSEVEGYFNSTDKPTALGLVDVLTTTLQSRLSFATAGSLTRGPFSISGGLDPNAKTLGFDIVIDADVDLQLPFDLEASAGGIGLSIDAAPKTQVSLASEFGFELNLSDLLSGGTFDGDDVLFQFTSLDASAALSEQNLDAEFTLGVLEGGVTGGMASLAADVTVALADGVDGNGDGIVTLTEITARSGDLIDVTVTPPNDGADPPQPVDMLTVNLPLTASIGGFNLGSALKPSITIRDANLFDDEAPTIEVTDLDGLTDLSNLKPGDIVLMLIRLGEELQRTAAELNPESGIPFVDTVVEEVVDFSSTLTELARKLYRVPVIKAPLPPIRLNGQLVENADFFIQVDGGTTHHLQIPAADTLDNRTLNDLTADFNRAIATAGLGGTLVAGRDGNRLTIAGRESGQALSLSLATASITAPNLPPGGGQLTEDLTFAVAINGKIPKEVLLPSALTEDNRNPTHLADDLNLALADAGLMGQLTFVLVDGRLVLRSANDLNEQLDISGAEVVGFGTEQTTDANAARDELGFGAGGRVTAEFKFNTLEELAAELNLLLADATSGSPFDVGLQYNDDGNGDRSITMQLNLGASFERAIELDFGTGLDLGIGNLEVIAGADAMFVADASIQLGIGIDLSAVGGETLTNDTLLSTLNGGDGVRLNVGMTAANPAPVEGMPTSAVDFTIDIERADGTSQSFNVVLPSSASDDNFDAIDLAADLNDAFTSLGLAIEAGATGVLDSNDSTLRNHLTLRATDTALIKFTLVGGDEIGFADDATGQASDRDDLEIGFRNGTMVMVNLDGSRTVGDVLDIVNNAAPGNLSAAISADGFGFTLTDHTVPVAHPDGSLPDFSVKAVTDVDGTLSPSGLDLGIRGTGVASADGTTSVIDGQPLHGDSIVDHFFIDTAVAGACGGNLCLDARITADDIDLQAALGIVDIGIVDGNALLELSTSIDLVDDTDDRLTFSEMRERGFSEFVARQPFTLTGGASLPIRSSVLTVIGGGLANPQIDVGIFADESSPIPEITFTTNDPFDNLLSGFSEFSPETIVIALQAFVDLLQNSDLEVLNAQIPLVNRSLNDTLDIADDLLAVARRIAAGPDLTQLRTLQEELAGSIERLTGS